MTTSGESQAGMPRVDRPRRRWPSVAGVAAVLAAGTGIGIATVAHHSAIRPGRTPSVAHHGDIGPGRTPSAAAQPLASAFAPAAYDQLGHQLVMLGEGTSSSGTMSDGTWIWDGSQWRRSRTSTTPTTSGLMASDPDSGSVLLYIRGMQPSCFPPSGDLAAPCGAYRQPQTWSWDGSAWHQLSAATPDLALAFVLDAASRRPLLLVPVDKCSTQTWTWAGGAWERLGAGPPIFNGVTGVEAATDPGTGHAVLVTSTASQFSVKFPGCEAVSATWRWDGSSWQEVASGVHWGTPFSLGADPATGQVLAFTGETWVWEGGAWTRRHPAHAPEDRIGPALAFDAAHHQMLLVGGLSGLGGGCQPEADTWVWDGSDWSQLVPPRCPSA